MKYCTGVVRFYLEHFALRLSLDNAKVYEYECKDPLKELHYAERNSL